LRKHNTWRRDLRNLPREDLVAESIGVDWPTVLEPWKDDPQHSFDKFYGKVDEILDKYVPFKKVNKKQLRLEAKPWITRGIIKSIKRRDKLLRKYIDAKDPVRKNQLHTDYKRLRNEVVAIIRRSNKMHYQKYFTENAGDIKKTWTGIKNVINISSKITGMPAAMLIDKKNTSDPTKIAEGFNNYFSTIAEKLVPKTTPGSKHFSMYLNNPLDVNFMLNPTDTVEIMSIIDSLGSESSGPYSIPTNLLKEFSQHFSKPISIIINKSLVEGIFPQSLKSALVCAILKKNDKTKCANYRPISLLSNTSKIFERVMYNRM
jgi:hypothetical protein